MSDLYDTDIVLSSEEQAERLRRVAAAERLSAGSPDWTNIIEEIEDMGRSEIGPRVVFLFQALLHELKAEAWPGSRHVDHWRSEALQFRQLAALRFVPSMQQRIDVSRI